MTGGGVGTVVAKEVVKLAWHDKDIKKRLAKLTEWWQDRKLLPVLLVGAGGVGKSTLLNLLAGEYDFLINPPGKYEESKGVEKTKVSLAKRGKNTAQKKLRAEIVVTPGQSHRRESTWTDYERAITNGKVRGVILFSCYGYHSLGIGYKTHGLYDAGIGIKGFVPKFLKDQRTEEVEVIKRLATSITASPGRIWLLTLVTKQDLWFDDKQSVEKFYTDGPYGEVVGQIKSKKGANEFRHEKVYASLVISKFVDARRNVLQPNLAGYDQANQTESLRALMETIYSLREWENRK